MKHITCVCLYGLLLVGVSVPFAGAQSDSLGTYARAVRKDKDKKTSTAKQFDNDNLPVANHLNVVGKSSDAPPEQKIESEAAAEAQAAQAANGDQHQPQAEQKPEDSAGKSDAKSDNDAKLQTYKEWQKKISAQKDQVDLLTRELDVQQREYRLRAAAFYADAGNRLRNSGSWDQEDAQYKQQVADKQKALDKAKETLDDLQEQARKAGVPSGMRE